MNATLNLSVSPPSLYLTAIEFFDALQTIPPILLPQLVVHILLLQVHHLVYNLVQRDTMLRIPGINMQQARFVCVSGDNSREQGRPLLARQYAFQEEHIYSELPQS